MKKVLNVHNFGGQILYRKLYTGGTFNADVHFRGTEVSDLIEWLLRDLKDATWMDYVTDDPERVKALVEKPYEYEGKMYHAVFAFYKTEWGRAILVSADVISHMLGVYGDGSPFSVLPNLGMRIEFSKTSQFIKAPKFLNRIMAPVVRMVTATTLIEADEDRCIYQLENGELFSIKHVALSSLNAEQKALVDGGAAISIEGGRKLGYGKIKLGFARRFWSVDTLGGGKGHLQCIPWLEDYDMLIFGDKSFVKTDFFAFGDMGELHPGQSYTDVQSFVNFDWYQPELGPKLALEYLEDVKRAMKDEWTMRRMLLSHIQAEIENVEDMDLTNPEGFLLRFAISRGISALRFPGLRRRAYRYLTSQVLDMNRLRIPMRNSKRTVGVRYYVTFDPYVIDERGDVIPERSRIQPGCIVAPGIKPGTRVAVYRNPNGHPKEMVILHTVWNDSFRRLKRSGLCLIGRGADAILNPLNGGDMDDSFNVVFDPEWVNAMSKLPDYPVETPLNVEGSDSPVAENRRKYSKAHVYMQIDDAYSKRIGIGPVVNMGIDDTVKSHPVHKELMIQDLLKRNEHEHADLLVRREDYQASFTNSNLESIIDGKLVLGTEVSDYHRAQTVYPEFFASSGRRLRRDDGSYRTSRIPDSKVAAGGYVLAKSGVDVALDTIRRAIAVMKDESVLLEWLSVSPADIDIKDAFPQDPAIVQVVHGKGFKEERIPGLLDIWRREWIAAFSNKLSDEDRLKTYSRIDNLISKELQGLTPDLRMEVAVEVYRSVYTTYYHSAKLDDQGNMRQFPDGLLWCRPLGFAFVAAMESKGFAGRIVKVSLNDAYHVETKGIMLVEAKDGVVYRKDDGAVIGLSTQLEDDNYLMDAGLIEIKPTHPGLLPLME